MDSSIHFILKKKKEKAHFNGYILFPLLWVQIIQARDESVSQNGFEEKTASWKGWLVILPTEVYGREE